MCLSGKNNVKEKKRKKRKRKKEKEEGRENRIRNGERKITEPEYKTFLPLGS